jgi:tungstate transport system substrate-binding protein
MALTSRRLLSLALALSFGLGLASAHAGDALRLAVVNTPKFSGLIDDLIADFKAAGGGEVTVYGGSDVFEKARAGEADLVIAHWGKAEVERFVLDGYGSWPRMVFSNQLAIVGPASDPAGIRGLTDAAEALKKIASVKAPFAVNAIPGITYASDILWRAAGSPEKGGWLLDPGVAKGQALKFAEEKGAYTIWGALPFLRFKAKHASTLELMVTADPFLQRVMAAIAVNPDKVPGVKAKLADAFVAYLTSPRGQARISAFRSHGVEAQLWWPAGRHNATQGSED